MIVSQVRTVQHTVYIVQSACCQFQKVRSCDNSVCRCVIVGELMTQQKVFGALGLVKSRRLSTHPPRQYCHACVVVIRSK